MTFSYQTYANPLYLDNSGQAEVSNLDIVALSAQDVPGSQVSVDVVLRLEVGHATRNLGCYIN